MGTAERPTGRGDLRAAGTVAFVGHAVWAEYAGRAHADDDHTRLVALLLADAGIDFEPRPTTGRT
jgi:hypothetical protein